MRLWIALLLGVLISSGANAAPCAPGAVFAQDIKIGSTFPFGTIHVGGELTKTFKLVNKDQTRPMNITNFFVDVMDLNNNPWIVNQRPSGTIPPGGEDCFTLTLIGMKAGVYKAGISLNADTDPPSEEDTFFTFDVQGEVLAQPQDAAGQQER